MARRAARDYEMLTTQCRAKDSAAMQTKELVMWNMLGLKTCGKIGGMFGALGIIALCAGFSPVATGETLVEVGITKPADLKPRELRFKMQGMIRETSVVEGQKIKKNQPLMKLDDAEEQAELRILQLDATDIRVQGAKVQSEVKQAELKRIKRLFDQQNSNDAELEKAVAEAKLAE